MTTKNDEPVDYEPCSECGFDHAYEPDAAQDEHHRLMMFRILSAGYLYNPPAGMPRRLIKR